MTNNSIDLKKIGQQIQSLAGRLKDGSDSSETKEQLLMIRDTLGEHLNTNRYNLKVTSGSSKKINQIALQERDKLKKLLNRIDTITNSENLKQEVSSAKPAGYYYNHQLTRKTLDLLEGNFGESNKDGLGCDKIPVPALGAAATDRSKNIHQKILLGMGTLKITSPADLQLKLDNFCERFVNSGRVDT